MTVHKDVFVNMPQNGVIINDYNSKKIPYVYYATKYYRNEKGKSITVRKCIGKKDIETGNLIPNNNYYALFQQDNITFNNKIIATFLSFVLKPIINDGDLNIPMIVNELSNITLANTSEGFILTNPLTKNQKNILKHFDIPEDEFINLIK